MTHTFTDLGYTSEGYKWGIATIAGSATLSSGAQTETIGHFTTIFYALASMHDPMNKNEYIYEVNTTVSGNVITLTWKTSDIKGAPASWGDETDASDAAVKVLCIGV